MKVILDSEQDAALILDDKNVFVTATTLANFGTVLASSSASFDLGFTEQQGTGILSYRVTGEYSQLAFQEEPQLKLVKWGEGERDPDAKTYQLEVPYKIWIADFHKDLLVGLRHFFSPVAIQDPDQPLYHTTFPNTNCSGYNGTSVGWVCLYRTGNEALISVQEKLNYAYERESGIHEPYNDRNMSGTDGPRFYKCNGVPQFETGTLWIAASNEGIDWASVLIPVKTSDTMHTTHNKDGEVYTFEKAISEPYYPYYPHNLDQQQKDFYEAGWARSGVASLNFDPKIMSRFNLVEAPASLNVEEALRTFSIKEKTNISFDVFTGEVADSISKILFNSRSRCCICGTHKGQLMQLVDTFTTKQLASPDEAKFAFDPDGTYLLHRYCLTTQFGDELLDVCAGCYSSAYVTIANFEADPDLPTAQNSIERAYILTKQGYEELMATGQDFGDRFRDPNSQDARKFSHYVTRLSRYSGPWIPTNRTAQCKHCNRSYEYKMGENQLPNLAEFGIASSGTNPVPNYWLRYDLDRCNSCIPRASSFVTRYESRVLEHGIVPFDVDEDMLYDGMILNDMSRDVLFNRAEPVLESVEDLSVAELLNSETGYTLVIDKSDVLQELERCECGFAIEDNVQTFTVEGCSLAVCDSCHIDCKYKSIVEH